MLRKITIRKFVVLAGALNLLGGAAMAGPITQDSQAAAKYFENKIAFEANPMSIKDVLDGKTQNAVIIDVRAKKDYEAGHIKDAINIPYDEHKGFEGDEKEFAGLTKGAMHYVYCYTLACALGPKACKKFAELGYAVKEVVGGFKGLEDAKLPVEK